MKYLCYDSALNKEYTLIQLMQRYPKHVSLFADTDDEDIWDAAPWLFELNSNPFELNGRPMVQMAHCIVFETNDLLKNVLDYLHSKIYIQENGQDKYFRIWDARVLLKHLPNWAVVDIQDFFQVFPAIYTESEDAGYLYRWAWKGGNRIETEKVPAEVALPVIKTEAELDKEYETQQKPPVAPEKEAGPVLETASQPPPPPPEEVKPKRRRFLMD